MKTICAAICESFTPPPPDVQLVAFAGDEPDAIRARVSTDFLDRASAYAAERQVYLVPGLYIRQNALALCLLDDRGNRVIEQEATHLNRSWAGDLRRGDDVKVAELPFGRVTLCVDVDIYKSEVLRIAALQGAEIVVNCQYLRSEDDCREMILAGAWQQAQQNCVYILNATSRHASILGPCEAAADRSGFLTQPSTAYPVQAELSAEKRAAAYQDFPVFKSLNPALYRRHAGELCQ